MMIIKRLIVGLFCLCSTLLAYEHEMLNLLSPSTLQKGQLIYGVEHRFRGEVDNEAFDTMLGSDQGAYVRYGLRYALQDRLDFDWHYTSLDKAHTLGLGFGFDLPHDINAMAGLRYFSFKNSQSERSGNSTFVLGAQKQMGPFVPVINLLYDNYDEAAGVGLGLEIETIDDQALVLEWFSNHGKLIESEGYKHNLYTLAYKINTFGHRFMLLLSNGPGMGVRQAIQGTQYESLFLGFEISRIFDL